MTTILRCYDWLIAALAILAGVIVALIFVAVVYDASLRDLGFQPTRWAVPLSEIGLLYITMLSAPWLLRSKGQIVVETLRKPMPMRARVWLERATYVFCIGVCAIMTWSAAVEGLDAINRGDVERLAIEIPLYLTYLPLIVGFFLLGCEFLRLLIGVDSLYIQDVTARDSI
jgi:TRAP-type C4-dicarboxylate transport system permease small subunit